ncbi:MAG: hypothetical protein K9M15_01270 [Candidatus Marinimicrobia bacterium]|nr:hypothetical protein [Candidatus Neomarinimicrobiota bacterium]
MGKIDSSLKEKGLIVLKVVILIIVALALAVWYFSKDVPEDETVSNPLVSPEPTNVPPLEVVSKETGEDVIPDPVDVQPLEVLGGSSGGEEVETPSTDGLDILEIPSLVAPAPTNVPPLEDM